MIASMGTPTITKPFVSILTLSPPVLIEPLILSSVQGTKGVVFNILPSAPHPLSLQLFGSLQYTKIPMEMFPPESIVGLFSSEIISLLLD